MKIYTIGYGGRKPTDFFALIPEGAMVIDVRRYPKGWEPAYCHDGLKARFGNCYLSVPSLGNISKDPNVWEPAQGQEAADIALHATAQMMHAFEALNTSGIVLMCAEEDPNRCHRRIVAEKVAELVTGLEIIHLGVKEHESIDDQATLGLGDI